MLFQPSGAVQRKQASAGADIGQIIVHHPIRLHAGGSLARLFFICAVGEFKTNNQRAVFGIAGQTVYDFIRRLQRQVYPCSGRNFGLFSVRILPPVHADARHFIIRHGGGMDYIHGEDVLRSLAAGTGCMGFLLPAIDKGSFFAGIARDGILPRKTFSMGQAHDKRFYLEARKIR